MANDVLKMIERCSDISPVSSLRILVGMLFGPTDFLGLRFEIISIISRLFIHLYKLRECTVDYSNKVTQTEFCRQACKVTRSLKSC